MRVPRGWQLQTPRSNQFSRLTDESEFSSRPPRRCFDSTTVFLLQPPRSLSDPPWIVVPDTIAEDNRLTLYHPLTLKRQFWNLPRNFDLSKLHLDPIAVSHHIGIPVDKLLVVPPGRSNLNNINGDSLHECTLLALYNGGQLRGCPRYDKAEDVGSSPWVKLSHGSGADRFDDITVFNGKIYVVDRQGMLRVINNYRTSRKISIGKTQHSPPVDPGSGRFGWRKRLVVDGNQLYLVVRTRERSFVVYELMKRRSVFKWNQVREFEGKKVLFMARKYYFFRPGREFNNCIVFSEAAFPQYGKDCWEFTQIARQLGVVRRSGDDVAVFRLTDNTFAREGESGGFPKTNWSPPPWIFHASSVSPESHSASESVSQSEREPDEDGDSDTGGGKDGEVQSDLKDSNSKDEEQEEMESEEDSKDEEQEGMESEEDSQDEEQEVMDIDSDSEDQENGKMQCDLEEKDQEMPSNANIGDALPSTDTVAASLSAAEEEVTVTLLSMSDGIGATVEETSRNNITHWELRACTSSTTKSHISDSGTTKFEGFDISSDLVPTLQKIWRKHGNIIENSIIHNGDILAKALESLGAMVQILEDNSAQSLTDVQADYLSSTLSDLRCMCFKVDWLISYVDNAVQLHKSKALMDKLAKLREAENKLKKEIAEVSRMIPFYGQVKFDEPLGLGLT